MVSEVGFKYPINTEATMTRQYRPQLDWTPDAKLPTRFAAWKSEIEDEVLLFESEDKPSKYICNFVKVCSGERGKAILRESNAHKEEKASEEMGYISFPPVKQPILLSKPIVQEVYTITTKMQATEKINAKKPSLQHRAQDH
ncbi:hypothetical protein CAPTEDRAFT_199900, partial [Capitella teleta]